MTSMEGILPETEIQMAKEILEMIMGQEIQEVEMIGIKSVEMEILISQGTMEIDQDLIIKQEMNQITQKLIQE